MNIYQILVERYHQLLSGFAPGLQWFITLLVLIGLVYLFIQLISSNLWFLLVLALFLPAIIPILGSFLMDIYNFFLYLLTQIGWYKPTA